MFIYKIQMLVQSLGCTFHHHFVYRITTRNEAPQSLTAKERPIVQQLLARWLNWFKITECLQLILRVLRFALNSRIALSAHQRQTTVHKKCIEINFQGKSVGHVHRNLETDNLFRVKVGPPHLNKRSNDIVVSLWIRERLNWNYPVPLIRNRNLICREL